MEAVWLRTHEKMAEGIDFDTFGPPEQLRVCEQLIPTFQDELGVDVCFGWCG
jgi:hypothetical protein